MKFFKALFGTVIGGGIIFIAVLIDIPQKTVSAEMSAQDPETFAVSTSYGHIVELNKGSNDLLVVCIRDRHADPEAQRNIARLLDELTRTYSIGLICLEGASNPLDTSYYDAFPAGEIKNKVAEYFLQQGFFTGAEYFKIISPTDSIYSIGVEDRETYLQHIQNYEKNLSQQNAVGEYVERLCHAIALLKKREYSPALKEIDSVSKKYFAHEIGFSELLACISGLDKDSGVKLSDYPNLERYGRLLEMEKSIDFKTAEEQRDELIQKLAKTLDQKHSEQLIAQTMRFKLHTITTEKYYEYLYSLYLYLSAIRQEILPDEYQELASYIDYISFAREVDFLKIDSESDAYFLALKRGLCETPLQERLVVLSKSADVLSEMASLRLSHSMVRSVEENPYTYDSTAISEFILQAATEEERAHIPDVALTPVLSDAFNAVREYYTLALKRDYALVENTINRCKEYNSSVAILVTGGFHTQGMTDILKEKNISYVVISPNPGSEDYEKIYIDRMVGNGLDVPSLAKFFAETLVIPLITSDTAREERIQYARHAFALVMGLEIESARLRAAEPDWKPFTAQEIPVLLEKISETVDLYGSVNANDLMYIVHEIVIDARMSGFQSIDEAGYGSLLDEAIDALELEYGDNGVPVAEMLTRLRGESRISVVKGLPDSINGHAGKEGIYIKNTTVSVENILHEALAYSLELDHRGIEEIIRTKVIPDAVSFNPIPSRGEQRIRDLAAGSVAQARGIETAQIFSAITRAAVENNQELVNQLAVLILDSVERKVIRGEFESARKLFSSFTTVISPATLAMIADTRMNLLRHTLNVFNGMFLFSPETQQMLSLDETARTVRENVEITQWTQIYTENNRLFSEYTNLYGASDTVQPTAARGIVDQLKEQGDRWKTSNAGEILEVLRFLITALDTLDFSNPYVVTEFKRIVWEGNGGEPVNLQGLGMDGFRQITFLQHSLIRKFNEHLENYVAQQKSIRTAQGWDSSAPITDNLSVYIDRLKQGNVPEVGVVPDIHGNHDRLIEFLDRLVLQQGVERLVFLGDLFDRGTQNREVFETIKAIKDSGQYKGKQLKDVQILMGNHDLFLILAMAGDMMSFVTWYTNGGNVAIENFTGIAGKKGNLFEAMNIFETAVKNDYLKEVAQWMMNNMSLYHIDPDHGTLYIHAGIPLDDDANLMLEYRGLTGAQALEAMSIDLKTVFADPELLQQAKEFNGKAEELKHMEKEGRRGDEEEIDALRESLEQQSLESPIGILSFLSNTGSPVWVRSAQWFGILEKSAKFQEYIAVLADETAEAQRTGRIRSVLEAYKLGLEEELNQADAADIGSVSHIKSVRAVAGALINLVRMAEGELPREFQSLYDGIGVTAMMQVMSPYDFDSMQNLFRALQDSISDVPLVENAVVQFLNQLVKTHDKKFDDLFKELGITGIVFGHTPGESVKAIKRDVFGMDMYMVKGYGGVMQIGKAGIGIDGALEMGGAIESLDAGVLITERIQSLEARLQRYRQPEETPVEESEEITVITRQTLDRLRILAYQKSLLLEGIDALLQQVTRIEGIANRADSEPLIIPDSAEPVVWLQENMEKGLIDFTDLANQYNVAAALKQAIVPASLSDVEQLNFTAETRAVGALQTFFSLIKNLPQTDQTQISIQVAGRLDESDQTQTASALLQARALLMKEVFPLLTGANLADFEQINPNYVDQDKILGSVAQEIDSLDLADHHIVQATALRLVLAIDPSYLIKQNVAVSSIRNFSVERITAEVNLLRSFLDRIQSEDTLSQNLPASANPQAERLDAVMNIRSVQEQLYETLSPLMIMHIRAMAAALNNDVAGGVRILSEGEIRDISPQEALAYSTARAEYDASNKSAQTPFFTARKNLIASLKDESVRQIQFLAPGSIRDQLAQLNLGDLLKPLAGIVQDGMPAVRVIEGTSIDNAQEIIMVEDINGDLTALQNSLRLAGLINNQNLWIGGEGIKMIQLGVKSEKVDSYLSQLAVQAKQAGSQIVRLIGQEELKIIRGDFGNADNPPGARGWNNTIDARNVLYPSIINGTIQIAQLVNGTIVVNGVISFNMKRLLIAEIADAQDIAPYMVTDKMIVDYINALFRNAVLENDFSHALFQESHVSGIVIADSGIAAEGFESVVHQTIDTAYSQGKLETYARGIGGKKIILVGDSSLMELAPGQRGHAGIKRNALYLARGSVTTAGHIDEIKLRKLALHEALELQRWQDEAVNLYLSGEYESLIAAGFIQLGDDSRDRYAQDSDMRLAERSVDQRINNLRDYHNELRAEYLAHLKEWRQLDTAGRSRQWNKLSPWMRRELRKMLRAWSIAYKNKALELSAKFHEEAERISPLPPVEEAVPDARQLAGLSVVITAPLETVSPSEAELTVQDLHGAVMNTAKQSQDIGLLIAEFARIDNVQMRDAESAVRKLSSIRNRLAVSFASASPAQVTQLERLVESRRKIIQLNAYQPQEQQALLEELAGINKIITETNDQFDAGIISVVSNSLDGERRPDPIGARRIESTLQRRRFDQVIETELLAELSRNPDLIRQINPIAFNLLVTGFQSFISTYVGGQIYQGSVQDTTLAHLAMLKNLVPIILDRAERPARNGLRNAFVNTQNRRPQGTGNLQRAEEAKRFAREFGQMLQIIESGFVTQGIFAGQSGLQASQMLFSDVPANTNERGAFLRINGNQPTRVSRIGGALKTVLDEDIQPIPEAVQEKWDALAANARLRNLSVSDIDITAKFIVDEDNMPQEMFSYQFTEKETGNLVIVLQKPVDESTLLELEAIYHEAREFYWIHELTPTDRAVTGQEQEDIRIQAHILASAEQVYTFGGKNGITLFHSNLIKNMPNETIERLITEDRSVHHLLYARYLAGYVAKGAENYEKRFAMRLRQQRLGQDNILYIQRFLDSLGLSGQRELRDQLITVADTFAVSPTTPLAAELLSAVGIDSSQTVVASDELIQQPLIALVSNLIRTSNQDITSAGHLFLAVQNVVLGHLQGVRMEKPFDIDTIERGVELTNRSI